MPTPTDAVSSLVGDVSSATAWAAKVGRSAPQPGNGDTASLWRLLTDVAAIDVGVARVLEPHLDALAILKQAGLAFADVGADESSSWGVYAAETPGSVLIARRDTAGWRLDGEKSWCSLARDLSHALVTARLEGGSRGLFAVDLHAHGVTADPGPWVARGLSWIVSAPVRFDSVPARPVGDPGWYLERPGFAWGGMGVAACWYGGAIGVARALVGCGSRPVPDQLALAHLGAVDTALHAAKTALSWAAACVDDPATSPRETRVLAMRTRAVIAHTAETVLSRTAHALGPAPLALDEDHARRTADLQLYIRQHHAERDDAALGKACHEGEASTW